MKRRWILIVDLLPKVQSRRTFVLAYDRVLGMQKSSFRPVLTANALFSFLHFLSLNNGADQDSLLTSS